MPLANLTLTDTTVKTANAAADKYLSRVEVQIQSLNDAYSGGSFNIKPTVAVITETKKRCLQNLEFLLTLQVITTTCYENQRKTLHEAVRKALLRRDILKANAAHDKIRNDLAKSYKPCDI